MFASMIGVALVATHAVTHNPESVQSQRFKAASKQLEYISATPVTGVLGPLEQIGDRKYYTSYDKWDHKIDCLNAQWKIYRAARHAYILSER